MIFVDAGYFIAQANARDDLYQRALRWAAAVDEPLVMTEFVLIEVVDALSDPRDRTK